MGTYVVWNATTDSKGEYFSVSGGAKERLSMDHNCNWGCVEQGNGSWSNGTMCTEPSGVHKFNKYEEVHISKQSTHANARL